MYRNVALTVLDLSLNLFEHFKNVFFFPYVALHLGMCLSNESDGQFFQFLLK